MTSQTTQPKTKKQPYTGDPNATMTSCPKKLRRHLPRDVTYLVSKSEPVPETNPKGVTVVPVCKHCKQFPYIQSDTPEEASPAE